MEEKKAYQPPAVIQADIKFTEEEFKEVLAQIKERGQEYTVSYSKQYKVDYSKSEVV